MIAIANNIAQSSPMMKNELKKMILDNIQLEWNRANAISTSIGELHQTSKFTDVELISGKDGRSFRAHQFILAQLSNFLTSILDVRCCSCKNEICRSPSENSTVILEGFSSASIGPLLELAYYGRTSFSSEKDQLEFQDLSKTLGIKGLFLGSEKRKASSLENDESSPEAKKSKFNCCRCNFETDIRKEFFLHSLKCSGELEREKGDLAIVDSFSFEMVSVKEEPKEDICVESGGITELKCTYCFFATGEEKKLSEHYCKVHFRTHLQKAFGHLPACPCCGKIFSENNSGDEILLHLGIVHKKVERYLNFCTSSDKDLSCALCKDDFENPELLKTHLACDHFRFRILKFFPLSAKCAVCSAEIENGAMHLKHLTEEHNVLFKVVPRSIADQLSRLDSVVTGKKDNKVLPRSHSLEDKGVPFDSIVNPNLICPVCEKGFERIGQLRKDLCSHYWQSLVQKFGANIKSCPFCIVTNEQDDFVLKHIALDHKKLLEVIPDDVQKLLKGVELFPSSVQDKTTAFNPTPSQRPDEISVPNNRKKMERKVKCPECNAIINANGMNRHLTMAHLRKKVAKHVDIDLKKCKLCGMQFKDNRNLFCHVSYTHGFIAEYLQNYKVTKVSPEHSNSNSPAPLPPQLLGENNVDMITKEIPKAPQMSAPAPKKPDHIVAVSFPEDQLVPADNPMEYRFTKYSCPFCNNIFKSWNEWRVHIFIAHAKQMIRDKYRYVRQNCPYCKRNIDTGSMPRHLAIFHNKVLSVLGPDVTKTLTQAGLMTDPKRIMYSCPLCLYSIRGLNGLKLHLHSHLHSQLRRKHYPDLGKECPDCGQVCADATQTLRHLSIQHEKMLKTLSHQILLSLVELKVVELVPKEGNEVGSSNSDEKVQPKNNSVPNLPLPFSEENKNQLPSTFCPYNISQESFLPEISLLPTLQSNDSKNPNDPSNKKSNLSSELFAKLPLKINQSLQSPQRNKEDNLMAIMNPLDQVTDDNLMVTTNPPQHIKDDNLMGVINPQHQAKNINLMSAKESPCLGKYDKLMNPQVQEREDSVTTKNSFFEGRYDPFVMCPVCGNMYRKSKLMVHTTQHFRQQLSNLYPESGTRGNTCQICYNKFHNRQFFLTHMGGVHGEVFRFLPDHAKQRLNEAGFEYQTMIGKSKLRKPNNILNKNNGLPLRIDSNKDFQDKGDSISTPNRSNGEFVQEVAPSVAKPVMDTNLEYDDMEMDLEQFVQKTFEETFGAPKYDAQQKQEHQEQKQDATVSNSNNESNKNDFVIDDDDEIVILEPERFKVSKSTSQSEQGAITSRIIVPNGTPSMVENNTEKDKDVEEDKNIDEQLSAIRHILGKTGKSHVIVNGFGCSVCDRKFKLFKSFKCHLLKHFESRIPDLLLASGTNKCPDCKIELQSAQSLKLHLAFNHHYLFPLLDRETKDLVLQLQSPQQQKFNSENDTFESRKKCLNCDFETDSNPELNEHIICHWYEAIKLQLKNVSKGCQFESDSEMKRVYHIARDHHQFVELKNVSLEEKKLFLATVPQHNNKDNMSPCVESSKTCTFIDLKHILTLSDAARSNKLKISLIDKNQLNLKLMK